MKSMLTLPLIALTIGFACFQGCATYDATDLHTSVAMGNVRGAQALLADGADPNAATFPQGRSPLQVAVRNGNYQMAKVLVDHGADVNAADWNGNTPLHDAVRGNYCDIARLLLDHGADAQAKMYYVPPATRPRKDVARVTPLRYCQQRGYENMEAVLRANGAERHAANW